MDTRLLFIDRDFVEKSRKLSVASIENMAKKAISAAVEKSRWTNNVHPEILKFWDDQEFPKNVDQEKMQEVVDHFDGEYLSIMNKNDGEMNDEAVKWFNLARTSQAMLEISKGPTWENLDEALYEIMAVFDVSEKNGFEEFVSNYCGR